jgi:DNA-binding MarR family transcriptional regulator
MGKSPLKPKAGSPVPLDRRFGYRFSTIGRALGQQMLLFVEREFGLTLAEYRILTVLENNESPSVKQIASQSQIDKAQVTRCMTALVEKGLVNQSVDEQDRRLRAIKLTRAGRALLDKMLPFNKERQERLERCVTRSELEIFWKVLARFDREVKDMLAEQMKKSTPSRGPSSAAS